MRFRQSIQSSRIPSVVTTSIGGPRHSKENKKSTTTATELEQNLFFFPSNSTTIHGKRFAIENSNHHHQSSAESYRVEIPKRIGARQDISQTHTTESFSFSHPAVNILLEEYYKLLRVGGEGSSKFAISNRYHPSMMRRVWDVITARLPSSLQFGNVLRAIAIFLKWMAPSTPSGIILVLLLWLVLVKALLFVPLLCLMVCFLGVYSLAISEVKLKEAIEEEKNPKIVLHGFHMEKDAVTLHANARPYLDIKRYGQVESNPLVCAEWPDHLPKPVNTEMENLESIERDIKLLRSAVLGPDKNRSLTPTGTSTFESIVNSIQDLCTLVGVDRMRPENESWEAIRIKIQELQDELGL